MWIGRNENARRLIDEVTETLSGYDQRRGNYTERYVDRYKLIEATVRECIRVIQQTDQSSTQDVEQRIKNYFSLK